MAYPNDEDAQTYITPVPVAPEPEAEVAVAMEVRSGILQPVSAPVDEFAGRGGCYTIDADGKRVPA